MDHFTVKTKDETIENLKALHRELTEYKVLDPACGSGNFLFIAYKEIKLLEREILKHLKTINLNKDMWHYSVNCPYVSTKQFYGIDLNPFAVELPKVTLMIAKEMSIKEAMDKQDTLPLDNLDSNIICADALFTEWPEVDAIIGNPPFQSHANMKPEFGIEYVNKVWDKFPEVSGKADFCVYWFYKAHNHLRDGCYAGLVGTNTITQNQSREGSLGYIVKHGGTIINAISSQKWLGGAAVEVSIASWIKGTYTGTKFLYSENSSHDLEKYVVSEINSSLSIKPDVTSAAVILANKIPKKVFKGQMPGHEDFMIKKTEALKILKKYPEYAEVLKPHLIGEDLLGNFKSQPSRFLIDFSKLNIIEASKKLFKND